MRQKHGFSNRPDDLFRKTETPKTGTLGATAPLRFGALIAILSVLAIIYAPLSGLAQKFYEPSLTERVGFAFYKLAGFTPKFEEWVTDRADYKRATEEGLQDLYMDQQIQLLANAFREFDPRQDFVTIETPVSITTHGELAIDPNPQTTDGKGKRNAQRLTIEFIDFQENFFPFRVGQEWIAMIPTNPEMLRSMLVPGPDFERMDRMLYLTSSKTVHAILEFVLVPTTVNIQTPIQAKGVDLWLMSAEVASFDLWTTDKQQILWSYRSDGYIPEQEAEILNLYKN